MRVIWRTRLPALVCALLLGCAMAGGQPAAAASDATFCVLDLSTGAYSCDALAVRAVATSSYLLARLYDAPNRSTANGYLDITAAGPCDTSADEDWELGTMPSGWNDRVSSFQGFSNCQVKVWQNGGFSGASYGPATSANTLGSMDNQTSSVTFY